MIKISTARQAELVKSCRLCHLVVSFVEYPDQQISFGHPVFKVRIKDKQSLSEAYFDVTLQEALEFAENLRSAAIQLANKDEAVIYRDNR